ncbi:cytochrome P450, family 96, subfamily A, polypeptide 10 [Actinidia rufa]|uniref:Cytochrome P450, family 96, subfamily A, polypeptide 10 n=1 Tax=Actinidia rufa TaxID=165716 RepID=A0A7J0F653_9ERIC|nr:cytochrome P450, family 96, subfamily A, polypeptide 10 [Actinidia rufa]
MLPGLLLHARWIHDRSTDVLGRAGGTFLIKGPWFADMEMLGTVDPANVHYIMSANFSNFPKGPKFMKIFDLLGDGIFNSDGDLWRNQRRFARLQIGHQRFHRCLVKTSQDKVEKGLIPILEHVSKQGLVAMDEAEEAIFHRHIVPESIWKLQRWLGIGQEKKLSKACETLDSIIGKYITMKRDELSRGIQLEEQEGGVDLLTSYLKEDEMMEGLKCDDKFLRDTILNFMIAGRDTTSSALTWFIWLVSTHPIVEAKIREELKEAIPTREANKWRLFSVEEVGKLVYLHSALCESLRLYPSVPFQHKEPLQPDILPSGHRVHPKMKPERWISERGTIKHEPSYKFLAFNAGPRTCLGKEVAFTQMKTVVAAIIHNYHVEVVKGHHVAPNVSIILYMKHGLMVRVTKRWF